MSASPPAPGSEPAASELTLRRVLLLVSGCVVLGVGVALFLTADLGSDGYSTLVNGIALSVEIPFWVANLLVGVAFVVMAGLRRVRPGLGTVAQVVLVGASVNMLLAITETPASMPWRVVLLVVAFPVMAWGIAAYLGSHTGAGPAEGAALAWDPPVPFRWSYSLVQGGGALVGWLLGATLGVGTVAVILVLGPCVDLVSRVLRLDVHQRG